MYGAISSGQSLTIAAGSGNGVFAHNFANAGSVTLDGGYLSLDGSGTNTGTITALSGAGDVVEGTLTNTGTVDVDAPLQYTSSAYSPNAVLDNEGAINVATGQTLASQAQITDDTGGTIADTGTGEVQMSGLYDQGAGTVTGTPIQVVTQGGLEYTGTGASSVDLVPTAPAQISGNIAADQSLEIATSNPGATVYWSGAPTNAGSVTLDDSSLVLDSGTLSNTGTFTSTGTGLANFDSSMTNTGTVVLDAPLALTNSIQTAFPTVDNRGVIDIPAGETLDLNSHVTLIDDTGGTISLDGAGAEVGGGFTINAAGMLTGDGTVDGGLTNSGTVSPGVTTPGTITVDGNYSQTAGGTLGIGITQAGTDALTVTGTATLAGTLATTTSGFAPTVGQSYVPVTFASATGTFATVSQTPSGLYTVTYTHASVTLGVVGAPTITVTTPLQNGSYPEGSVPDSGFSCADGTGGPGISSCTASVDGGSPFTSGAPLVGAVGPHTMIVTAVSSDGQETTDTISYAVTSTAAPTALSASPQLVLLGSPAGIGLRKFSATLTSEGQPVEGQTVSFTVGSLHLCTATTSQTGVAECEAGIAPEIVVILANHYTATYAGTTDYQPATATAAAIEIGHGTKLAKAGKIAAIHLHHNPGEHAHTYRLTVKLAGGKTVRETVTRREPATANAKTLVRLRLAA